MKLFVSEMYIELNYNIQLLRHSTASMTSLIQLLRNLDKFTEDSNSLATKSNYERSLQIGCLMNNLITSVKSSDIGDKIIQEARKLYEFIATNPFTTATIKIGMKSLIKCSTCNKQLDAPLVCGGCKQVQYCDTTCQKADWKQKHRHHCEKLKAIPNGAVTAVAFRSTVLKDNSAPRKMLCMPCNAPECKEVEKDGVNFAVCGGCRSRRYCSPECQKTHFKEHKKECQSLRDIRVGTDENAVESDEYAFFQRSKLNELFNEKFTSFRVFVAQIANDIRRTISD